MFCRSELSLGELDMKSIQMDVPWCQKLSLPWHSHEESEHQIDRVVVAEDRNLTGVRYKICLWTWATADCQMTNTCSLQESENRPVSLLSLLFSYQLEWSHKSFFHIYSYTEFELWQFATCSVCALLGARYDAIVLGHLECWSNKLMLSCSR